MTGTTGSGLRTIALPGGDVAQLRQLTSLTDNFLRGTGPKTRFKSTALPPLSCRSTRFFREANRPTSFASCSCDSTEASKTAKSIRHWNIVENKRCAGGKVCRIREKGRDGGHILQTVGCYRLIDPTVRLTSWIDGRAAFLARSHRRTVKATKPPAARPCAGLDGAGA